MSGFHSGVDGTVYWNMVPCTVVCRYRVLETSSSTDTNLDGIISQKILIFVCAFLFAETFSVSSKYQHQMFCLGMCMTTLTKIFHALETMKNKLGMYADSFGMSALSLTSYWMKSFFSAYLQKPVKLCETYIWHRMFVLFFTSMFVTFFTLISISELCPIYIKNTCPHVTFALLSEINHSSNVLTNFSKTAQF